MGYPLHQGYKSVAGTVTDWIRGGDYLRNFTEENEGNEEG
jgi:hypothetical protein